MTKYFTQLALILAVVVFNSCNEDDGSLTDGLPSSIINTDPEGSPPRGLTGSWNGQEYILSRQILLNNVGVYYDTKVDRSIEWPLEVFPNAWAYITSNYGSFSQANTLYVSAHGEALPSFYYTHFDAEFENRNLIVFPLTNGDFNGSNIDLVSMLLSQIVENANNNIKNSPASAVWQDKFQEIFLYDLYLGLDFDVEAERVRNAYLNNVDNFPNPNTKWFENWFLPIYETYGETEVLTGFFDLLAANYPVDGNIYARDMTLGELVHFFSGTTGADLEPQARIAFGINDIDEQEFQQELLQARAEFPNLDYPFDPASELIDVTSDGNATIEVSSENSNGSDAEEGSLKLIDNDFTTKFLTSGFPQEFYAQQVFATPQVVNRYTLTSGNDAPSRDFKSWALLGSNDGVNFDELDVQTDIVFADRLQTIPFSFENETPYLYYRIRLDENNGSSLIQIIEWRLLNLSLLTFDPQDVTNLGVLSVNQENGGGANAGEGSSKLIDNDINTKFLVPNITFPLEIALNFSPAVRVTTYTLTSANDFATRDPSNWILYGSNDNITFTEIDNRSDIVFEERLQTKEYLVPDNTETYSYYKLEINGNGGSVNFQIAEWRVFAED